MKILWKRIKSKGFTLVELLVVIAIIGILVSIVMPAITNALTRGKLTQMAANGRNLIQALMGEETGSIYMSQAVVWPISGSSTKVEDGIFDSSTDYFAWLVTNDIMNVNFNFFSGPGVPAAPTPKDFVGEGTGNRKKGFFTAWCIAGDVGPSTAETCPVLLTRNLGYDSEPPGEDSSASYRFLDDDLKIKGNGISELFTGMPFQNKGFVFVLKGGAALAPFKNDMKGRTFTNIYQTSLSTNAVIRPCPGDGGIKKN